MARVGSGPVYYLECVASGTELMLASSGNLLGLRAPAPVNREIVMETHLAQK